MSEQQGRRYAAVYHTGRQALLTDQVLTSGQLLRIGSVPDLFPSLTLPVRTTSDVNSERLVTFHALTESLLKHQRTRQLAHLAGVAEMRLELGVPPGHHWTSTAQVLGEVLKPDATWKRNDGRLCLIEFDSCDYPRRVVQSKIDGFRAVGPVYWGTTSPLRVSRGAGTYPDVHFLLALWWETPEERRRSLSGVVEGARNGPRIAASLLRNARRYRQDGVQSPTLIT